MSIEHVNILQNQGIELREGIQLLVGRAEGLNISRGCVVIHYGSL